MQTRGRPSGLWCLHYGVYNILLIDFSLQIMRLPYALQVYFMQIHEGQPSAGIYSVEDGRVVGHLLMDVVRYSGKLYTSKRAKRRQAAEVAKFVMRTAMLGDAAFGHLCDMLRTILVNKYHVVREVAATDPALLTRARHRNGPCDDRCSVPAWSHRHRTHHLGLGAPEPKPADRSRRREERPPRTVRRAFVWRKLQRAV